ncbi:hypothetical protein LV779_10585 [Streptomyces thinghirensis]|nr:hypothetical protein [Streptomyces thinghirensis]
MIHLLAELIDNAHRLLPAPHPVGVRAALVAKGLNAVEIRGPPGGSPVEEDYASFNAQLAVPPAVRRGRARR